MGYYKKIHPFFNKITEECVDIDLLRHDSSLFVKLLSGAYSRYKQKGFSKTVFSECLNKNGIEYIHLKKLGSPKDIRKELKQNKDYFSFFEKYLEYIQLHKSIINELYKIILEKNCCIMCYENLPSKCHRKIICDEIEKIDGNGLKIEHL